METGLSLTVDWKQDIHGHRREKPPPTREGGRNETSRSQDKGTAPSAPPSPRCPGHGRRPRAERARLQKGGCVHAAGHAHPGGPGASGRRRTRDPWTASEGAHPVRTQGAVRVPERSDWTGTCGVKTQFAGSVHPQLGRRSRKRQPAAEQTTRPRLTGSQQLLGERGFIRKLFRCVSPSPRFEAAAASR